MPGEFSRARASAIAYGFQIVVGLNNGAQAILRGTVAAIGVGVVALHQGFEPRLDIGFCGTVLKPQGMQCLALGIAHHALLGPWTLALVTPTHALALENIEGIGSAAKPVGGAAPRLGATADRAIHSDLPRRPMASDRFFLIGGDSVVAHAGEEIIRVVVFAHMREAKAPVFALVLPALGRAMGGRRLAAAPFADRICPPQPALGVGLDPDSIKMRRVEFHNRSLCRREAETFKS